MIRIRALFARITPRHILTVTGVAVLTLVLTVALRDTVREFVVVPMSALAWTAGLLINSVPQIIWLGVLVLVGAIIAIRSLSLGTGAKSQDTPFVEVPSVAPTRLAFWMGRLSNAKRSPYTAERALNELRTLVIDCLAHEYRLPQDTVLDLVRAGNLEVTAGVRAILLEDRTVQPERTNWLRGIIDTFSALFARINRRNTHHDVAMPREFQNKVNTLLVYVESMNN